MKVNNRMIGVFLLTVMLFISTFLTWGTFDFKLTGEGGVMPGKFDIKVPAFNGQESSSFVVKNPLKDVKLGGIFRQDVNGWKTSLNLGGFRLNTWILVMLCVLAGLCILAVDSGALKMGMMFPRVFLVLGLLGTGFFTYVMIANNGIGEGSVMAAISIAGLLIISFVGKAQKTEY